LRVLPVEVGGLSEVAATLASQPRPSDLAGPNENTATFRQADLVKIAAGFTDALIR
jgi:hypothetical protein